MNIIQWLSYKLYFDGVSTKFRGTDSMHRLISSRLRHVYNIIKKLEYSFKLEYGIGFKEDAKAGHASAVVLT